MYEIADGAIGFIPSEKIEAPALRQIELLATMPFIHRHVAVMPDCHLGRGATVGSMIPTLGAIIPAAVGVDIGCGMIAARTESDGGGSAGRSVGHTSGHRATGSAGGGRVQSRASRRRRSRALTRWKRWRAIGCRSTTRRSAIGDGSLGRWGRAITLLRWCWIKDERVWGFLHSGSRGVGASVANFHIKVAQSEMERDGVDLPDRDLAFLTEGTATFDDYIADLFWCQNYARLNRDEMMDRVIAELSYAMFEGEREVEVDRVVSCHHNFTERERHFGEDVWVSRKGAISAFEGQAGLIPGSMGTRSYIVSGLGNAESFCTAPHGAGRRFSRTEARRRFTMDDYDRDMKGIEANRSDDFLDELPGAYKDIDEVMEYSKELVEIAGEFRQVVNVKGASGFRRRRRRRRRRN